MIDDGIIFSFVKDGIVYPVALTESDLKMCRYLVAQVFDEDNKLVVLTDRPMGELEEIGEKI